MLSVSIASKIAAIRNDVLSTKKRNARGALRKDSPLEMLIIVISNRSFPFDQLGKSLAPSEYSVNLIFTDWADVKTIAVKRSLS